MGSRCDNCGMLRPQLAYGETSAASEHDRLLPYEGYSVGKVVQYERADRCMFCRAHKGRKQLTTDLGIVWSAKDSRAVFK